MCKKWYTFLNCVLAQDYELERERLDLENILGEGQFGDVHAGKYTDKVHSNFVLIFMLKQKICYFSKSDVNI